MLRRTENARKGRISKPDTEVPRVMRLEGRLWLKLWLKLWLVGESPLVPNGIQAKEAELPRFGTRFLLP